MATPFGSGGFGAGPFGGGVAAGLSSFQVLLDNFTGTFPYDITAYQQDEVTFSRGKPDESSDASAGTATLTLDNSDGRFTLAAAPYGISVDQQIRILVNGIIFWTGYVQEWPVSWPGGAQTYSTVQVTAVDGFARLARLGLRSAVEEDILVDIPAATYPLSEAAGATTAGDTSLNGGQSLAVAGAGTAMSFGSGTGPTDGLTCAQFGGGKFLRNSIPQVYVATGAAFTVEAYFATSTTPTTASPFLLLTNGSYSALTFLYLGVTFSGKLVGTHATTVGTGSLTSTASVNDGLVHHAMLTLTAGGTLTLYLDGVSVGTAAGTPLPQVDLTTLSVGGEDDQFSVLFTPYIGTVAHPTLYPSALPAARAAVHADARNDHTGETPAARYARVAAYSGVATGVLDTAGGTTLGPANQGGRGALDVINETAAATLGMVTLDGLGRLTSFNGYAIAVDGSPDVTLDANNADPDTVVDYDMSGVINEATGGSTSSENTFTAGNAFSKARHGLYHQDFTWNVNTDAQVVDRTNWIVSRHSGVTFFLNPTPRFSSLTLNVHAMTGAETTAALLLDVSSYLFLTNMPSQWGVGSSSADLIVQGIQWSVSSTSFTITVNCSKRQDYNAWILGDALYGVLDSTTTLYV